MTRVFTVGLVFLFLPGCATTASPIIVQARGIQRAGATTFSGERVLILSPALSYRKIDSEKILPESDAPYRVTSGAMVAHAKSVADRRGFVVVDSENMPGSESEDFRRAASELTSRSADLLKDWTKDRDYLQGRLRWLGETTAADAVLVQGGEMKMGQPDYWDPILTGAVEAGTSTSALYVGLLETSTGRQIWHREIFYRALPDEKSLPTLLEQLFEEFPTRSGAGGFPEEKQREEGPL